MEKQEKGESGKMKKWRKRGESRKGKKEGQNNNGEWEKNDINELIIS